MLFKYLILKPEYVYLKVFLPVDENTYENSSGTPLDDLDLSFPLEMKQPEDYSIPEIYEK